jgi:hypothetical protein
VSSMELHVTQTRSCSKYRMNDLCGRALLAGYDPSSLLVVWARVIYV